MGKCPGADKLSGNRVRILGFVTNKSGMKRFLLLMTFLSCFWSSQAQTTSPVYHTAEGAIKGYDPVAYFILKKPVKGKKEHAYEWGGQTWYFFTADTRKLFVAHPEKYAPQYGGYCAYGLSRGYKAKIEPEAWSIVDDKLYLNYDLGVQKDWNKKQAEYIEKADRNWPNVKDQKFKE